MRLPVKVEVGEQPTSCKIVDADGVVVADHITAKDAATFVVATNYHERLTQLVDTFASMLDQERFTTLYQTARRTLVDAGFRSTWVEEDAS